MHIPDSCYSLLNTSINPKTGVGNIIVIKCLELGYYKTELEGTQDDVDEMNLNLGVQKHVAKAMETASMFGWHTYLNSLSSYSDVKSEKNDETI